MKTFRTLFAPALALLLAPSLHAGTVTNTTDADPGSLRDAISAAAPGETIDFAPGLSGQTITLASQLTLAKNLTIVASGLPNGIILNGNGTSRIFTVTSGTTAVLDSLTLTNGSGSGAGNVSFGYPYEPDAGGGIYNIGALTLRNCTTASNSGYYGGGITNAYGGTLTVNNSTVADNRAHYGGGILNFGTLVVEQSTFSGNWADDGGGISNEFGAFATLSHCTVTLNQSTGFDPIQDGGGGIDHFGASLTLTYCILAGNTAQVGRPGPDLWMEGSALSASACIIGDGTTSSLVNGVDNNQVGINALLAPLGNYGGRTQTVALLPGSPARDAAVGSAATSDQRGYPRPVGAVADIGAYEAGTFANYNAFIYETLPATATNPEHATAYDFDGDGYNNLLEYALRRDPSVSDAPLGPMFSDEPSDRLFSFPYRAAASDLRFIVQRSSELTNVNGWTEVYQYNSRTGAESLTGVTGGKNSGTQVITITDTATGPRLFWRVLVDLLP